MASALSTFQSTLVFTVVRQGDVRQGGATATRSATSESGDEWNMPTGLTKLKAFT
jgi:hypothetical protein